MIELILAEGTVCGEKYHTVHPSLDWVISNEKSSLHWPDMEYWCNNTFGPTPIDGVWTPHMRWYMNNRKFWFRDKKDLEWFVLKWG